jgi:hypothetical protein
MAMTLNPIGCWVQLLAVTMQMPSVKLTVLPLPCNGIALQSMTNHSRCACTHHFTREL